MLYLYKWVNTEERQREREGEKREIEKRLAIPSICYLRYLYKRVNSEKSHCKREGERERE